jgi:lipopolysaccharide exporter
LALAPDPAAVFAQIAVAFTRFPVCRGPPPLPNESARVPFKLINLRGDLFATIFSFGAQTLIRLGSSLILTRILRPEAYGIITIVMSVVFIIGMLSDVGMSVCIVRDPHGDEPRYLNTAWTIRLVRALINGVLTLILAGPIAQLYGVPALILPLRVLALWFIIDGFESTAFPLAIRRKNARVVVYAELVATLVSTVFSVIYCYLSRDYWGMVYGALVNRLVWVCLSYRYYRELRPRLQYDRESAREIFKYTRFVMPSSALTVVLSQFDKIVFLRLFDLRLLGVYGLAGNIAGSIEGLISKASQTVLYPRAAHDFRVDPSNFAQRYYAGNVKFFMAMLTVPAAVGGAAVLIVTLLYDPRFALAGPVLQAFMLRAVLLALATGAEDMLVAAGEPRVILIGNLLRAVCMPLSSFAGYALWGFMGFTYGIAFSGLPPLIYYLWLQRCKGLLIGRYELYRVLFACVVALAAFAVSNTLMSLLPIRHISLKH